MRIYVSHSASVASAPKLDLDPDVVANAQAMQGHGSPWFVVEPITNPELVVDQLVRAGRTVYAIDVDVNVGRCVPLEPGDG